MKRDDPARLLAACLPSELAVLGLLDITGPLDAVGLGTALQMPAGAARQTAERLVALGLVVLTWPGERRPPRYGLALFLRESHEPGANAVTSL